MSSNLPAAIAGNSIRFFHRIDQLFIGEDAAAQAPGRPGDLLFDDIPPFAKIRQHAGAFQGVNVLVGMVDPDAFRVHEAVAVRMIPALDVPVVKRDDIAAEEGRIHRTGRAKVTFSSPHFMLLGKGIAAMTSGSTFVRISRVGRVDSTLSAHR